MAPGDVQTGPYDADDSALGWVYAVLGETRWITPPEAEHAINTELGATDPTPKFTSRMIRGALKDSWINGVSLRRKRGRFYEYRARPWASVYSYLDLWTEPPPERKPRRKKARKPEPPRQLHLWEPA